MQTKLTLEQRLRAIERGDVRGPDPYIRLEDHLDELRDRRVVPPLADTIAAANARVRRFERAGEWIAGVALVLGAAGVVWSWWTWDEPKSAWGLIGVPGAAVVAAVLVWLEADHRISGGLMRASLKLGRGVNHYGR